MAEVAARARDATGERVAVAVAVADRGYSGERPAEGAAAHGIRPGAAELPEAKRGFVLLARRWAVARGFARMARFRRLARGYGRLRETLAGRHFLACATLMLARFVALMAPSP